MIFPKKIKKGDTIGTTAVSMGCVDRKDELRLENAIEVLKNMGYSCVETENVRKNEKFVSSSPKERAEQFMELWKNEDIKWIIATSGGEFLVEMIPFLDKEIIKNSMPKWVQGYSDPSVLNYYLTTNFNIATANGANIKSFGMKTLHPSLTKVFDILENCNVSKQKSFELFEKERVDSEDPYLGYNLTEKVEYKSLYKDKGNVIKGRVIGGCIDAFSIFVGTEFDNTANFCKQFAEGMLWYIDNCELSIPSFCRLIWQLKQAHWFDNANGFLIGRTANDGALFDFDYLDALHKAFDDLNVPVFYDVDIGHLPPQWIMINGSAGEFKLIGNKGEITQKME